MLVHRRHRRDALAHVGLDLARDRLHLQQRRHRLQVVLHPVVDFAEQHVVVRERRGEVRLRAGAAPQHAAR